MLEGLEDGSIPIGSIVSSSFLGLPYRFLTTSHKNIKALECSLWPLGSSSTFQGLRASYYRPEE